MIWAAEDVDPTVGVIREHLNSRRLDCGTESNSDGDEGGVTLWPFVQNRLKAGLQYASWVVSELGRGGASRTG